MHFAHNVLRTLRPFTNIVTRCKLGRNARLVARIEKLRLCPKVVVFPQASHFAIDKLPFKHLDDSNITANMHFTINRIYLQEELF